MIKLSYGYIFTYTSNEISETKINHQCSSAPIYELPSLSEEHLESMVDFAVEVQNIRATLSSSDLTSHLNNPEFEQWLVSKLPGRLPAYWGMHKRSLTVCKL